MQDVKLDEVIKAIQKQTEFTFFYSPDDISDIKVSRIELEKASLEKTLDECLSGTNIEYEIVHKAVILKKVNDPVLKSPDITTSEQPQKTKSRVLSGTTKGFQFPG